VILETCDANPGGGDVGSELKWTDTDKTSSLESLSSLESVEHVSSISSWDVFSKVTLKKKICTYLMYELSETCSVFGSGVPIALAVENHSTSSPQPRTCQISLQTMPRGRP
jgi:hypothetical protein